MTLKKKKVLIKLTDINKKYTMGDRNLHVLKNLDLTIYQGEFIMIMGKSGSGKTTLMNIVGLLDSVTEGSYFFNKQDVSVLSENEKSKLRNENIGFIFQQFFLINSLNVSQNIELPMLYKGNSTDSSRYEQITKYLELVGLKEKEKAKITELSGGQQQRIAISRALINEPLLIMADEPTGALDSETSQEIMALLTQLNQSGKTIIMVTHDNDMKKYASRVIYMKDGQFLEEEDYLNA